MTLEMSTKERNSNNNVKIPKGNVDSTRHLAEIFVLHWHSKKQWLTNDQHHLHITFVNSTQPDNIFEDVATKNKQTNSQIPEVHYLRKFLFNTCTWTSDTTNHQHVQVTHYWRKHFSEARCGQNLYATLDSMYALEMCRMKDMVH